MHKIRFTQFLIRIQKSDFIKRTKKFLVRFILVVVLHSLGATFFYSTDFDTNW